MFNQGHLQKVVVNLGIGPEVSLGVTQEVVPEVGQATVHKVLEGNIELDVTIAVVQAQD